LAFFEREIAGDGNEGHVDKRALGAEALVAVAVEGAAHGKHVVEEGLIAVALVRTASVVTAVVRVAGAGEADGFVDLATIREEAIREYGDDLFEVEGSAADARVFAKSG
jgi:hypothetical protein